VAKHWGLDTTLFVLAAAVSASGCSVSGLAIRSDDRVDLLAPAERAEVTLPLVVDWEADDLAVGPGGHTFGVLVDRTPPRPGRTLESLFDGGDDCHGIDGCPDAAFLAQRLVFRTTDTELTLDHIPASTGERGFHVVTVVLLDDGGARDGEGAWSRRFEIRDER